MGNMGSTLARTAAGAAASRRPRGGGLPPPRARYQKRQQQFLEAHPRPVIVKEPTKKPDPVPQPIKLIGGAEEKKEEEGSPV